jgi:hypothetical protein
VRERWEMRTGEREMGKNIRRKRKGDRENRRGG